MRFSHTKEFAEERLRYDEDNPIRRGRDLVNNLIEDIGDSSGRFEFFRYASDRRLNTDDAEVSWRKPLFNCSWGDDVESMEHFHVVENDDKEKLGIPFNIIWTHIDYRGADGTVQTSFSGTVRSAREEAIAALGTESGADTIDRLDAETVYFLTFDGPGYSFPELMVAGPGPRDDTADRFEEIGVQILELNDAFDSPYEGGSEGVVRQIEERLGKLTQGEEWHQAFDEALETREATRNYFKSKIRKALSRVMELLSETAGGPLQQKEGEFSARELEALHAASVLLAFRLIFLHELERRDLLYTDSPGESQPKLDEYLSTILQLGPEAVSNWEPGDFTRRLLELSRMIVEGRDELELAGGSIFQNLPNERTFDKRIAEILDRLEAWFKETPEPDLANRWDEAIAETGELLVGRINADDSDDSHDRLGAGGTEHTHRVLGDIYEQMLALVPAIDGSGKPCIREPSDDESSKQKQLAAYYTPRDLVFEVVRPTLGHLFKQRWDEVDGDVNAYLTELYDLKIVDPAMGSGHFLTAAALEVAREISWARLFEKPRPFEWHEPAENPNTLGKAPADFEPAYIQKTRAEFNPPFKTDVDADEFRRQVGREIAGVVRRSIYGVDKNPLACELGKLSLWLFSAVEVDTAHDGESSADDRPDFEQYLDDNIKCGDSLVGLFLGGAPAAGLEHYDSVYEILQQAGLDDLNESVFSWQKESFKDRVRKIRVLRRALSAVDGQIASTIDGAEVLDMTANAILREYSDKSTPTATSYDYREAVNQACNEFLEDLAWLYDLAVAVKYINYTSRSGVGSSEQKPERLAKILTSEVPNSDIKSKIEGSLAKLLQDPFSSQGREVRTRLQTWVEEHLVADSDARPFHWELEFSEVFSPMESGSDSAGFDAVVANPPFIGDRDIRERLGDNEALVDYFTSYFIPQDKTSEYAGFFFYRYSELIGANGTVGSLASNSIGQASNREYITKTLTACGASEDPVFEIRRAAPNRCWPGEANVHFASLVVARPVSENTSKLSERRVFIKTTQGDNDVMVTEPTSISSYLDEYPDFNPKQLLASPKFWTGCFLRGNFSIHREPGQSLADAVEDVPKSERDALAAYINADAIQQNPRPTPLDVVVDFQNPLMHEELWEASAEKQLDWLQRHYPELLRQLSERSPHAPNVPTVKETRKETDDGRGHDKYWWLFGYGRTGLREAWDDVDNMVAFPRVTKVWSPLRVPRTLSIGGNGLELRICPTEMLFLVPQFGAEHLAVTCSFLFEMIVRRQSSSLGTGLRLTPTKILPYFPWPWQPGIEGAHLTVGEPSESIRQKLELAGEHLLEVRTKILENPGDHGLSRDLIGGPTDLYNIYNRDLEGDNFAKALKDEAERAAKSDAIKDLRRAHVELLTAVLDAYAKSAEKEGDGQLAHRWEQLANQATFDNWLIDHPWLDRTPRFVPEESIRAELFELIDRHNTLRYKTELNILKETIIPVITEAERTTKSHFDAFEAVEIDRDTFDLVIEHLFNEGQLETSEGSTQMPSGNSNWKGRTQ